MKFSDNPPSGLGGDVSHRITIAHIEPMAQMS